DGADRGCVRIGGQVQPRVDRDAVAADGDAGLVDVGVGLGVGGLDHVVHVDAVVLGEQGEFVGQGDVHVPVGGLGQLRQLTGLRAAQVPHPVGAGQVLALIERQGRFVELTGPLCALLGDRADQLGVPAQV